MNISDRCQRYDDAEAALPAHNERVPDNLAKEFLEAGRELRASVQDKLSRLRDRSAGQMGPSFTTDLAYFAAWIGLRGGWRRSV